MKFYLPDGSEGVDADGAFQTWLADNWAFTVYPHTVDRNSGCEMILQIMTLEKNARLYYGIGESFAEAFAAATEHATRELRENNR